MKRVILRAPALSQSGYGIHSRQIARYLLDRHDRGELELYINLVPWGQTQWLITESGAGGLAGRIMERTMTPTVPMDVSMQLQLPNEWDPKLAAYNIGITAGVETDKCNPKWVQAVGQMNGVIVPSTFTKDCLENTGKTSTPITVIPEAYIDEIDAVTEPLPIELSTSFNFLVFGQLTGNNKDNDRKNIFYTLKWLCEEFKDDEDVGIILKTNMGRGTRIDRSVVKGILAQLMQEVRRTAYPKLHLIHGDMSSAEVAGLLKHPTVKGFCLLTRGEGFCLPMLEAAATGIPVIAPAWSGYMDFMGPGKFIQIEHEMRKVHGSRVDENIFMADARWAWPSEKDFKRKIRKFRRSHRIPTEWAQETAVRIRRDYCHGAIARHYDEYLKEII